jgi:hypothetical protein
VTLINGLHSRSVVSGSVVAKTRQVLKTGRAKN